MMSFANKRQPRTIRFFLSTSRRLAIAASGKTAAWTRGVRIALPSTVVVLLAGTLAACVQSSRLLGPEAASRRATHEELMANWPQFRGPGGNGVAGSQDPPTDWDGASGINILWKAEVPRPGQNSPVVWGDRVFLSGGDESAREIFCWNAETGKLRWRTAVPRKAGPNAVLPIVDSNTGFAAPTMAVNGREVFALFATGDLAALDFSGKILWTRDLGVPEMKYGCPLLAVRNAVIVQHDQTRVECSSPLRC
jgi:hypothetical protein